MEHPPPPPPPHGSQSQGQGHAHGSRTGGLPDGKYDIFIIPPTSAGAGFLYLPSMQTNRNSFLAGCACTAAVFFVYQTAVPVFKQWLHETMHGGGPNMYIVVAVVGLAAWAFGKTQGEGAFSGGPSTSTAGSPPPQGSTYGAPPPQPQPQASPPPPPPPNPEPQASSPPPPKSSWQRPSPQAAGTSGGQSAWEKAREETRKREEERRKAEELKRRREELEKERQKQREKDARERAERELKEKREKEAKERATALAAAEVERKRKEAEEAKRKALLEEARKREEERKKKEEEEKASEHSSKRPPMPSVNTVRDDDAYSFRPYDRTKTSAKAASIYSASESSYAPSATTARTTPPLSTRGPYSTKDPDKIIIKAVYSFNNAFMRTPITQLVSGQGNVTDGLILRITPEGLFIDDDVRGVPQREWDVKAWTMKLVEVWCPSLPENVPSTPKSSFTPFKIGADSRQAPSPSQSVSCAFVMKFIKSCSDHCRGCDDGRNETISSCSSSKTPQSSTYTDINGTCSSGADETLKQSIEISGLHVLRASIRDQEGKKYVFILSQSEGWKVAIGLQRLRRGTQVRALGVSGMPQNEGKAIIDNLGWT